MRSTLMGRSKLFAPVVALAVVSLGGGRANGQEAAPTSGTGQMQTPAPAAGAPPPGGLTPAQYAPPPPQETPPPQDLPATPQEAAPPQPPYAVPAPYAASPAAPFSPPTLVQTGGVPVRFTAGDGGDYFVSVTGALSGTCRVPCTLQLAPGITTIRISGSLNTTSNVAIPNAPAVAVVKRGSPGIRTTGAVFFILGSAGGLYLTATNKDASELSTAEAKARLEIAIVDLALVAVGAVMALAADKPGVDVRADSSFRASERAGGVRFAGVGAAPTRGGAVLGAALQF